MKKSIYCKSGIYGIVNVVNWKMYIGKGLNIRKRWDNHRWKLNIQTHENLHLQNAWNKYGEENFKLIIIEECEKEKLIEKEIFYIYFYNTVDSTFGYNMTIGGDGIPGYKHTDKTKSKMSKAATGRTISKEQIQKRKNTIENWTIEEKEIAHINMSNAHMGQIVSKEQRERLSKLYKGKPSKRKNYFHSNESKSKLSESLKRYWAERRTTNES